jgi:ABC-type dipeptide/oligopeptide/nickel transport system permease component
MGEVRRGMSRRDYLIRKLLLSLVTVLFVVVINFVLFRILPGDPVRAVIGRNVNSSIRSGSGCAATWAFRGHCANRWPRF